MLSQDSVRYYAPLLQLYPNGASRCMGKIMKQCSNGSYSSYSPLKVIILAAWWGFSFLSRKLAIQLAKFPQVQVSFLVPEDSCSEWEQKRAARYGVTIVEAKQQPGFDDPVDWLNFPPQDLATDIVVGEGERLGKIAQFWKERLHCKSIYVASDLDYQDSKSTRESRHQRNVGLCQMADLPIAIGQKMTEKLAASLCFHRKKIVNFTPGVLSEFSEISDETHARKDGGKFCVLVLDGGNQEGLDIAAKAIAELDDKSYHLFYVSAVTTEVNQKQLSKMYGIAESQLTIQSLPECEEDLKRLFCEVDLAIMPSGEQGFEMMALAALSSGLPMVVHEDSGFGEDLKKVNSGTSSTLTVTVDSEDAKVWATAIKKVRETERKKRLEQAELLRSCYNEQYSWEKQCGELAEKMFNIVSGKDIFILYFLIMKRCTLLAIYQSIKYLDVIYQTQGRVFHHISKHQEES